MRFAVGCNKSGMLISNCSTNVAGQQMLIHAAGQQLFCIQLLSSSIGLVLPSNLDVPPLLISNDVPPTC